MTITAGPPTLVVAEVFGPTIAGEGPSCGRRCGFIRLGGCNLTCSFCDSGHTWDARRYDLRKELTRRPVTDVVARALVGDPGLVVITGGEPLLHQHQPGWAVLLDLLTASGVEVEVETNGTLAPAPFTVTAVTRFNVSPKLEHAGDPAEKRIRPDALRAFHDTGKAAFKFVCATLGDVQEAADLSAAHGIPARDVWIMPEGTSGEIVNNRLAAIADTAVAHGFNLTTRLHIATWGDERGR